MPNIFDCSVTWDLQANLTLNGNPINQNLGRQYFFKKQPFTIYDIHLENDDRDDKNKYLLFT